MLEIYLKTPSIPLELGIKAIIQALLESTYSSSGKTFMVYAQVCL